METEDDGAIWCLALSPDNERIFSGGGNNGKLFINNVNT